MLPLWHIAVLTWLLAAWLVAPLASPRAGGASPSLSRVDVEADTHATIKSGARQRLAADDVDDEDAACAPRGSALTPTPVTSTLVLPPARSCHGTTPWRAAMPRGPPIDLA